MVGVRSCVRSTARTFDRKALCSPLRGAAGRYMPWPPHSRSRQSVGINSNFSQTKYVPSLMGVLIMSRFELMERARSYWAFNKEENSVYENSAATDI